MNTYYDVIVAGGGTAGVIAAIASARGGANTLIVEQNGYLGGTAAMGIPFLGIFDGMDRQVNAGIVQELIARMKDEGGSLGGCFGTTWNDGRYRFSITPFDEEIYKYVAQEMVLEAGCKILFHSFITSVESLSRTVRAIRIANKSGENRLTAKVFIDATGDADIAAGCGVSMIPKAAVQNSSILFKVNGVDNDAFLAALKAGQGLTGWGEWHTRILTGPRLNLSEPGPIHIAGHITSKDGKRITFTAVSPYAGEVCLNASRTINIDGTDAESLTNGEISERRHIHEIMRILRSSVPGFENAYITASSPLGIRESRNIDGVYRLEKEDVISGREFEDSVARGAYPIDQHDPKGGSTQFCFISNCGSYSIPYRCYLTKEFDNLLVAGRCISASHTAMGSARIMGAVMSGGQAVGTAAALAVKCGTSPVQLDVQLLRGQLRADGAIL